MFDEWFQATQIANRGIGSDTTRGLLERIDDILVLKPAKIFIMIGINDLGDNFSMQETLNNYTQIISRIQEELPDADIYLQSVLPCNANMMPKNERNARRTPLNITQLNNQIELLAQSKHEHYVDLYSHFVDNDGNLQEQYTYDGVHLSALGFVKWKECISSFIQ